MKKQSLVLIILILIAYCGISQTYKNDSTLTCIPNYQLKQAVILIEEGKLAKQELYLIKEKVQLLEKKLDNKDTLINSLKDKDLNWKVYQHKIEQSQNQIQIQINNLEESNKVQKKISKKYKNQRWLFAIIATLVTVSISQFQ